MCTQSAMILLTCLIVFVAGVLASGSVDLQLSLLVSRVKGRRMPPIASSSRRQVREEMASDAYALLPEQLFTLHKAHACCQYLWDKERAAGIDFVTGITKLQKCKDTFKRKSCTQESLKNRYLAVYESISAELDTLFRFFISNCVIEHSEQLESAVELFVTEFAKMAGEVKSQTVVALDSEHARRKLGMAMMDYDVQRKEVEQFIPEVIAVRAVSHVTENTNVLNDLLNTHLRIDLKVLELISSPLGFLYSKSLWLNIVGVNRIISACINAEISGVAHGQCEWEKYEKEFDGFMKAAQIDNFSANLKILLFIRTIRLFQNFMQTVSVS